MCFSVYIFTGINMKSFVVFESLLVLRVVVLSPVHLVRFKCVTIHYANNFGHLEVLLYTLLYLLIVIFPYTVHLGKVFRFCWFYFYTGSLGVSMLLCYIFPFVLLLLLSKSHYQWILFSLPPTKPSIELSVYIQYHFQNRKYDPPPKRRLIM